MVEKLLRRLAFVFVDDPQVIPFVVHEELGLHREDGRPVVHSRALLQHTVIVRPLDGNRFRHVHDIPAAVKPGGLCDIDGIADLLAQALRVAMEGE